MLYNFYLCAYSAPHIQLERRASAVPLASPLFSTLASLPYLGLLPIVLRSLPRSFIPFGVQRKIHNLLAPNGTADLSMAFHRNKETKHTRGTLIYTTKAHNTCSYLSAFCRPRIRYNSRQTRGWYACREHNPTSGSLQILGLPELYMNVACTVALSL